MKIYISKTLAINEYDGFHLVQDHIGTNHPHPWNDYGYYVTFWLYHVLDSAVTKITSIKLLINGEMDTTDFLFPKGDLVSKKISNITSLLSTLEAVSLGESASYYQKINFVLEGNK
ncbi:hypothetical protein [Thaumasiovibrio subtropicus]|uniref:hypothetical protein n=1 Tax=Thaumasiovibrio subtropicus TaxID=1891207 RepID=UPI001C853635|nr:hypothetical protein [Thaumasiovibrio subtropicus]